MKLATKILVTFSLISCCYQAMGTHIVGGEITYTCLGNNNYEIQLTVFRDCYNGNPNAWFDDPASIGFFDQNNILVDSILIDWDIDLNDTLDPLLSDSCFVAPPDVCVHTTTYNTIVNLPIITGGYQVIYQRCCRNQTIINIVEPLDVGATFGVNISEQALLECNSSPKFNAWPPIYICVNQPINFDQSAFDADGDSIVYKLCTPLAGASPIDPIPQPPNPPPYEEVPWFSPPYGLDNMLNSTPNGAPLKINSETGLLTGTPNTVGQFVVGICIEEYRDEQIISTTRRDFQYNVGVCGRANSSFFAPDVQCDGFTVQFENMSDGADNYQWFFNDPSNPNATSDLVNPIYTYPDTGLYTIMLIAEPNSACVDTAFQSVLLYEDSLFPEFEVEYLDCSDSLTIQVVDMTIDTLSAPSTWAWSFTTDLGIVTNFDEQNPVYVARRNEFFNSLGTVTVALTVTADNGCEKTFTEIIEVLFLENELSEESVNICFGEMIELNPQNANSNAIFNWMPTEGLSNPNIPNPIAQPDTTTTYIVVIENNGCEIERRVTIEVPPPIEFFTNEDTIICDEVFLLETNTTDDLNIFWSEDPNFSAIFSEESEVMVMPDGLTNYYLMLRDSAGCSLMDTITIDGQGIRVSIVDSVFICEGDSIFLVVQNDRPAQSLTYQWSPLTDIVSGINTESITIFPQFIGEETYSVYLENEFGCNTLDSIQIGVIENNVFVEITPMIDTIYEGDSVQLMASFNPNFDYTWSPSSTLSFPDFDFNPYASPLVTTDYTVIVRDPDGCEDEGGGTVVVLERFCTDPFIFVPTGFTPNNDGKNDYLEVFGNNIDELQLLVYNRWGEKVFESNNQDIKWDGTLNGKPLSPDVFAYYLQVRCFNGERFVKKGNVTLIR